MHGPPLAGWLLVVLCAASGAYCLVRMRGEPPGAGRRGAGAEALMGWGMAVMAVPSAVLDPRPWGPPAFAVVFGVAAARALLAVRGGAGWSGHHLHHAIGALAMVYTALVMAPGTTGGHDHAGAMAQGRMAAGVPLLTGALLAYFAVYVVRCGLRLVPLTDSGADGGAHRGTRPVAWSRRPELGHACRLSMAIGMFAMLLTL
ncbi:DUF5134 domain-containing protein [Streptomyces coffeae]|uniref:DUF5134 domain-containing protein n=1 Tax=Streptomyces coffeae TaxID=621382 RepID=A0ABS1N9W6_9ACTN|nr:DUF5134 domain-containing protein [Streptomyces coffeae]MBL1096704.1 DUF5134 domain-containing protein [Streptomyces coffeae]